MHNRVCKDPVRWASTTSSHTTARKLTTHLWRAVLPACACAAALVPWLHCDMRHQELCATCSCQLQRGLRTIRWLLSPVRCGHGGAFFLAANCALVSKTRESVFCREESAAFVPGSVPEHVAYVAPRSRTSPGMSERWGCKAKLDLFVSIVARTSNPSSRGEQGRAGAGRQAGYQPAHSVTALKRVAAACSSRAWFAGTFSREDVG
jgi:hypothetical protein